VFERVVTESSDAPKQPLAEALGRLLYLVHLAVLLWWLLDKSPNQRATAALVSLTQQLLPSAGLALRVPPVRKFVTSVDELVREAAVRQPRFCLRNQCSWLDVRLLTSSIVSSANRRK
jgi:hypothetical protein